MSMKGDLMLLKVEYVPEDQIEQEILALSPKPGQPEDRSREGLALLARDRVEKRILEHNQAAERARIFALSFDEAKVELPAADALAQEHLARRDSLRRKLQQVRRDKRIGDNDLTSAAALARLIQSGELDLESQILKESDLWREAHWQATLLREAFDYHVRQLRETAFQEAETKLDTDAVSKLAKKVSTLFGGAVIPALTHMSDPIERQLLQAAVCALSQLGAYQNGK